MTALGSAPVPVPAPGLAPARGRRRALDIGLAALAGGVVAGQARLNGELGARTGSALLADLASFVIATVVLTAGMALARRGDLTLRRWWRGARGGPAWLLTTGVMAALIVLTAAIGVPLLGVTLASIIMIGAQVVVSLWSDRAGLGAAGVQPLTAPRVGGGVVVLGAIALGLLGDAGASVHGAWAWIGLVVLLAAGGTGSALQQAANGRLAAATGSSVHTAYYSFVSATLLLVVLTPVVALTGHLDLGGWPSLVHEWWLYLGGPAGVVFVLLMVVTAVRLDVLTLSLAIVAGQLAVAVLLDALTGPGLPLLLLGSAVLAVGGLVLAQRAPAR